MMFETKMGWRCIQLATVMLLVFSNQAAVSGGEPWVKIEEDWELTLNQPDAGSHSPQLTIYLTPNAAHPPTYFQLQLNHAADATFSGGGFRVSAFADDTAVDEARSRTRNLLTFEGDVVRWTSVMTVQDGQIFFAIKEGSSRSWGEFGGPEYLLRMPSDEIQDLSGYTPLQSIRDIDLGFGRNRIESLTLKRVRAFREDGSSLTVEMMRDAFRSDDD